MSHPNSEARPVAAVHDENVPESTPPPPATNTEDCVEADVRCVEPDEQMADLDLVLPENESIALNGNLTSNGSGLNGPDVNMMGDEKPTKSKKKSRLQWDEENLTSNALEMERTPRMKIDEPKTPFLHGHGSEAGSSTSGSAPHSPASPAVAFIPAERLQGFQSLEDDMGTSNGKANGAAASSNTRSVHIVEDATRSSGSSPRSSSDFAAKRKRHYQNEARLSNFAGSDTSRSPREPPIVEVQDSNIESTANGAAENGVPETAEMGNGGNNV